MAAKVITYVGRKTDFKGQTLWEIVGRLKNFGVGRIVVRSMFERYNEPCFMKIVKVETCPNEVEEARKVRVWVEKTFRGRKLPTLKEIHSTSYKADYKLIPKNEEATYWEAKLDNHVEEILPNSMEMPPLMKAFIEADYQRKGLKGMKEYTIPLIYHMSPNRVTRIAAEGEKPTKEFTISIGKPASPSLYEGINL